ncbi:mechanosensitive ion channel [Microcella daejeonensis]|uniref:Mechanosensitive ion channel n=1 Tax=Microcella daejeonensis TaxID=2994971 RepID=A0A9E8MM61_9MICO|nr:mechanosensitive ion channel domain-containing protein [Microcella daejeonensis]WAB82194.1 mechanosensitive ion channel [Microcella daejeonensis]
MPLFDSFVWRSWTGFGLAVVIALVIVVLIVATVALAARVVARRRPGVYATLGPLRRRLRLLLALIALWVAVALTFPLRDWMPVLDQLLRILVIAAGAWVVAAGVTLAFERTTGRYDISAADNRVARRMRTQLLILKRLALVVIGVVAIGSILLTFDGAEAVGASLLASAGLASVVAGLAAQSTLANLFAGMQLAFSDAIRVDDVVIVEGEFGRIEEITLTYVVVRIWDQRRMVLPSTYFTTTPFQNWTRTTADLMGPVVLDLDWRVDVEGLRAELDRVLAETPLWNGAVSNIQIVDATGGMVRARALISAADSGQLWDLQVLVREKLVAWVRDHAPEAMPVQRLEEAAPVLVRPLRETEPEPSGEAQPESE